MKADIPKPPKKQWQTPMVYLIDTADRINGGGQAGIHEHAPGVYSLGKTAVYVFGGGTFLRDTYIIHSKAGFTGTNTSKPHPLNFYYS